MISERTKRKDVTSLGLDGVVIGLTVAGDAETGDVNSIRYIEEDTIEEHYHCYLHSKHYSNNTSTSMKNYCCEAPSLDHIHPDVTARSDPPRFAIGVALLHMIFLSFCTPPGFPPCRVPTTGLLSLTTL